MTQSLSSSSLASTSTNINVSQSGVTGASVAAPNATTGSQTSALNSVNSTQAGIAAVQGALGGQMAAAGVTGSNIQNMSNSIVSPALNNNVPMDVATTPPTDPGGNEVPRTTDSTPAQESAAKKAAMGEGSGGGGLTFPAVITSAAKMAHMKLKFDRYIRGDAQSPGSLVPQSPVYLPLPEDFNVEFNISYDVVETGATGAIVNQMGGVTVGGGATSTADLESAIKGMSVPQEDGEGNTLSEIGKGTVSMLTRAGYQGLDTVESGLGGLVGGAAGASGFIQKALGQIPNPHPSVFFKGLPLRAFAFRWKLVPLNQKDANILKDIIKHIKKQILPAKDGDLLDYPSIVTPSIEGTAAAQYGNFLPCFVEGFAVNFTGEGTSAFFHDGSPVSVLLTLQLRESELYTQDKVN